MQKLPIEAVLPDIAVALREVPARPLIVEAPPGAGKTTRVPALLLDEPWCQGKILVSEPRRIAARLSATRVAEERGCRLGDEVGYQVRFDDKTSKATRLVYLTEALLLRRLLHPDGLRGVSAVILDEVHEQSADLDVALAILDKSRAAHPNVRVVAMSATLDSFALTAFFGDAQTIRSEGRAYPVEVRYLEKEDERPLEIQVRSALRGLYAGELSGDSLVFLPGAREIERATEALKIDWVRSANLEVLPLYGELPISEQSRVVSGSSQGRRIILSTNVAESSVTIPRVSAVVDSGQARVARHDSFSGAKRLVVEEISRARCDQRSGRAGRTSEGVCLRLYTAGNFQGRPAQETPELRRAELSELSLLLLAGGVAPETLRYLAAPESAAWASARKLLEGLGALDSGHLSELGEQMARLPLPPRLARVLIEAARLGIPALGADAAALLSERDILRRGRPGSGPRDVVAGDSDLEERLELLDEARRARFSPSALRGAPVDVQTARQVDQVSARLSKIASNLQKESARAPSTLQDESRALTACLLAGFFDQVATRKPPNSRLLLASGAYGDLAQESSVQSAALLLAVAADRASPGGSQASGRSGLIVRLACRLDPDWFFDQVSEKIEASEELVYDPIRDVVDETSRLTYGKLTLDESRQRALAGVKVAEVLSRAAMQKGAAAFDPDARLEALAVRLGIAAPKSELGKLAEDADAFARRALLLAAETCTRLKELAELNLAEFVLGLLTEDVRQALRREVPETVALPGGRVLTVHYERGRPPWAASRLQDFFSLGETPALCQGRLPLQLHLLAPNKRAVQVTTDLSGFWERHYPEIRRQLMRRYPRHSWPEDGRTAPPPPPNRLR